MIGQGTLPTKIFNIREMFIDSSLLIIIYNMILDARYCKNINFSHFLNNGVVGGETLHSTTFTILKSCGLQGCFWFLIYEKYWWWKYSLSDLKQQKMLSFYILFSSWTTLFLCFCCSSASGAISYSESEKWLCFLKCPFLNEITIDGKKL